MDTIALILQNNRLAIRVKPNARKNEILKFVDGVVYVAIAAPAENDEANKEVLRFFTKLLKRRARFVIGLRSKEKVLEFD